MPGHHSDKQKRQASHIEESYLKRGKTPDEAKSIAWASVNSLRKKGKGVSMRDLRKR